MAEALFIRDGDRYLPTDLTRGGWSDDAQHGSPPCGLLARDLEQVPTVVPMEFARFTVDLFRPVPLQPLEVRTRVRRNGRRIQVVDASLRHREVEVGRASALRIRTTDLHLPERSVEPWEQPAGPHDVPTFEFVGSFGSPDLRRFHRHAVEIRPIDDSFIRPGPGVSWFRLRYPLVAGEEPSPFVRLATLADMSNGNSQALDARVWVYVNPDLTLYVQRPLEGEWVGMRSAAHQHDSGIGVADTQVFDQHGPIGRINQAQLLDRR